MIYFNKSLGKVGTMEVQRQEFLQKLIALKDKQIIKVVTGVRRCGKSTVLNQFKQFLLDNGVSEDRIISINFEDLAYEDLCDYKKLYEYITNRLQDGEKNYVFLDEIQYVKDFPKAVDSLFIKDNVDLYITGSNSYMLSGEIATLISGRYIQINMLPLSFKEFCQAETDLSATLDSYNKYIQTSSFPYVLQLQDQPLFIKDYLESIYNSIVIKDIILRKQVTDIKILKDILRFVFDNIGGLLSSNKIADTLTSYGRKTDAKTVEKYLEALSESYVVYQAKRYNIKGKQYLKTLEKYYVVDVGLRAALLPPKKTDFGKILENIVYLELLRRGNKVFVGKVDDYEVDFVAQNDSGTEYYQVALTVRDESTFKRELKPLLMIKDNYPKYLLTLDDDPDTTYEGIKCLNAKNWLLSN